MELYFFVKTLHILSAAVLMGTGLGIAFFMWRSMFTDNLQEKLYAAKNTVLADMIFTLPAIVIQPLSGFYLIYLSGYDMTETWLVYSYTLYVIAGLCWLPVVWLQFQMKKIIERHIDLSIPLSSDYNLLFRLWVILGIPAFTGLIIVYYLMVAKPV